MWFKSLSAVVLFSSFNTLGFLTQQSNVLPGFHITIKSNNTNDILVNNKWNKVNDTYQNFISNNIKDNLIKVRLNNLSDIIENKLNIKEAVYNTFINDQINNKDLSFLKEQKNHFDKSIGNSFANLNFDTQSPINSFGNVYIHYEDSLKTHIENGIFATVFPEYDFSNYFSVPYTLEPSTDLLNQTIDHRITVIPINNDNWNPNNERELVIFAKKDNEQLVISGDNPIVSTDHLAFALLDHNINDGFNPTFYDISVTDNNTKTITYTKKIKLTNTTSQIQFIAGDSKNVANTNLNQDYLVFNEAKQDKNFIAMTEAQLKAKVQLFGDSSWVQYKVDPKTLAVDMKSAKPIADNTVLGITSIDDNYQVYYLQQQAKDATTLNNSGQYLVVYRTTCPKFDNWTTLNDESNTLLVRGFQQYLAAISTDMSLETLEKNPSQLITYFIDYQKDLKNNSFINYFGSNQAKPWIINSSFHQVTIVSNWKIIIIAGLVILFLTFILPVLLFLLKKEKRLK